jgi:hypothetical protein
MLKTRILTTSEARSKHFIGSSGQGYTTISETLQLSDGKVVAGPRNFMVKTAELDEFVELVIATRDAWNRAKEIELNSNEKT